MVMTIVTIGNPYVIACFVPVHPNSTMSPIIYAIIFNTIIIYCLSAIVTKSLTLMCLISGGGANKQGVDNFSLFLFFHFIAPLINDVEKF